MKKVLAFLPLLSLLYLLPSLNKGLDSMVILKPNEYLEKRGEWNLDDYGNNNKEHITAVFVFYNIPVEYDIMRRILIPKSTAKDTNFVRTTIKKSFDEEWLNRHIRLSSDSTGYVY